MLERARGARRGEIGRHGTDVEVPRGGAGRFVRRGCDFEVEVQRVQVRRQVVVIDGRTAQSAAAMLRVPSTRRDGRHERTEPSSPSGRGRRSVMRRRRREVEPNLVGRRAPIRRIKRRERVPPTRRARLGRRVKHVPVLFRAVFVFDFAQESRTSPQGGIAPFTTGPDGAERMFAQQPAVRSSSSSSSSILQAGQAAPRIEFEFAPVARERTHVTHADPAGRTRARRESNAVPARAGVAPQVAEPRPAFAVSTPGRGGRQRSRIFVPPKGGVRAAAAAATTAAASTAARNRAARRVRESATARR